MKQRPDGTLEEITREEYKMVTDLEQFFAKCLKATGKIQIVEET